MIIFFFLRFYLFARETMTDREHEREEGQREKQTPCWAGSLMWDSSWDSRIMTWAEGSRLTNWATQAPVPILIFNNVLDSALTTLQLPWFLLLCLYPRSWVLFRSCSSGPFLLAFPWLKGVQCTSLILGSLYLITQCPLNFPCKNTFPDCLY